MLKSVAPVFTPHDFLDDVEHEVQKAKKRVFMQSMYFQPGKITTRMITFLEQAAYRGLDVRLTIDWFDVFYLKKKKTELLQRQRLARLRKNGVTVAYINKPEGFFASNFMYFGRNHMKMTVVDDICYLGGINFGDIDFTYLDFMVKISEKRVAAQVAAVFEQVLAKTLETTAYDLPPDHTIVIDDGSSPSSLILDEACKLVDNAKQSVQFVNMFAPDGKLLAAMYEAKKRGVSIEILVPHTNTFDSMFSLLYFVNRFQMHVKLKPMPLRYTKDMIHAKLLLVDNKIALFGSHNLTQKGVLMHTAEIAIITHSKEIVNGLTRFIQMEI